MFLQVDLNIAQQLFFFLKVIHTVYFETSSYSSVSIKRILVDWMNL